MAYLKLSEARELSRLTKAKVSDSKLQLLVDASTELIDAFVGKPYPADAVTSTVKLVSVELIVYLSKDKSIKEEQAGDYSYTMNDKAMAMILQKLELDKLKNLATDAQGRYGKVRGGYI
jgi:hypothetical protein